MQFQKYLKHKFRYGLSTTEAEKVVKTAKESQVDLAHVHPISLLDIWSPRGLIQDQKESYMRRLVEHETAKLSDDCSSISAIRIISEKIKSYGLEGCNIDAEWKRLLFQQLGRLEEVALLGDVDANMILSYHMLLWKTGRGWTYKRTPKERNVHLPYNPTILGAFCDKTKVTTELSGEKPKLLDLTEDDLHHSLAAVTVTHDDWREIGLLQFFAETLTIGEPLLGPVSQHTIAVSLESVKRWGCAKAKQESIDRGEASWPNILSDEEFTLTNSKKKLFDIRHDVIKNMSFGQFLTQYRLIKDRNGREHKSLTEQLPAVDPAAMDQSAIGPLSRTTLIAGTLERAPRFMRFSNSSILKLREKKNLVPMLSSGDQTLDDVSKVFLFKPWRRPEALLREENMASVTEEELKACDRVRLELFPESFYCSAGVSIYPKN